MAHAGDNCEPIQASTIVSTAIPSSAAPRPRARPARAHQRDDARAGREEHRDLRDLPEDPRGTDASVASDGALDHGAPVWAAW